MPALKLCYIQATVRQKARGPLMGSCKQMEALGIEHSSRGFLMGICKQLQACIHSMSMGCLMTLPAHEINIELQQEKASSPPREVGWPPETPPKLPKFPIWPLPEVMTSKTQKVQVQQISERIYIP